MNDVQFIERIFEVVQVSWAVASDVGVARSTNEDAYCARPELGLFVVADGMGGHVAGEVASRCAVESIEIFVEKTENRMQASYQLPSFDTNLAYDANRLQGGFKIANQKIAEKIAAADSLQGMATTAVAVLINDAKASVAHVGDSRAYLLRHGKLQRLTVDHSWVEEQVQLGTLSAADAQKHPWRNVVTRALAGGSDPVVDLVELSLMSGDRLLLCSDGLFTVLADERIGEVLGQSNALQAICGGFINEVNSGGGPDNVTTLVLQIDVS